ncbi:MAG TPA: hypothetical protein VGA18_09060 [Rhodothermales bacterium]
MLLAAAVMVCGFVAAAEKERVEAAVESTVSPAGEPILIPTAVELAREVILGDRKKQREALLWLARCIFSESSEAHEQELVAWVVRNRVETEYRGRSTYRHVVLDPFQFSAFNPDALNRSYYMTLDETHRSLEWRQALGIAKKVLRADADERPFPLTTRHFYSERSLADAIQPDWSLEQTPVSMAEYRVDERRFRFFDGVN